MAVDGRSRWPVRVAWGACGLGVAQAGASWLIPDGAGGAAWAIVTLLHLLGLLGGLAVALAAGWRGRAGGAAWGWLILAPAPGAQLLASLFESLPAALAPPRVSPAGAAVIILAAVALAAGPARIWAEQSISAGSTVQRLLEGAIVALVALIALSTASAGSPPPAPWLAPTGVARLAGAYALLGGLGALLLAGRGMAGFAAAAIACRLAADWFAASGEGRAAAMALDTLQWAALALGAAYRASPAREARGAHEALERDDIWRGAFLTRILLSAGLLMAALSEAPLALALTLAATGACYEGAMRARHSRARRAGRELMYRERAGYEKARDDDRRLIQSLARLVHDLGPPVQGVSSIADQLQRIAARRERASPAALGERLGRHADHLEHLIRQLNAGLRRRPPSAPRFRKIDVMLIAAVVVESMQPQARRRKIALSLSIGTDETEIVSDEGAVRRILDNLVSNALAATPLEGAVVVELRGDRARVGGLTIAVRDTGPGLSEAEQRRVFHTREQPGDGPGMGLGLSIVAELAHQLGGTCGVRSAPGGGSTFWVCLPCDDGAPRRDPP